jgi:hypothetical protein
VRGIKLVRRIVNKCFLGALFVLLNSANATAITFQFSGTVTQVPVDEVFGDLGSGDEIQGTFTFDSSASDLIPNDPTTASYSWTAPLGMTVTVGSHTFDTSGLLSIGILNGAVDQYTVLAESAAGDLTLELFLQDNTGEAFSSDHLPLTAPPLDDFAQRDFHLDGIFEDGKVQADGRLNSLSGPTVPEPETTPIFLAVSIVVLILARRKRLCKSIK